MTSLNLEQRCLFVTVNAGLEEHGVIRVDVVEFDASVEERFSNEAAAVAHVGSFAAAHQADHSFRFSGFQQRINSEKEVRSDEERGKIDRFGVFAEDGRVLDASNFVSHVDVFESGGGDRIDQIFSAEVFPVAARGYGSNIYDVGYTELMHELHKSFETSIPVPSGVNDW
jgi:hypothetical protein